MENVKKFSGISAFTLHLLAMGLMLCDHLWATIASNCSWLTWLGRMAFPIFAFMVAEGYHYTGNFNRYLKRMLLFALISEIPFNLMYGGSITYPFHQNVLWTFALALLCMKGIDRVRQKNKLWLTVLTVLGISLLGFLVGTVGMMDYYGFGVLTVLLFWLFRGKKWWQFAAQVIGLYCINAVWLGGLTVPLELFGRTWEISQQGLAVLALIPIWLYNGTRGRHNKFIQYGFYAFYPAHMLILSLIAFYA